MHGSGLSLDAIFDAIADRVAERLRGHTDNESRSIRPRLLNIEQAAQYLGRTRDSVEHLIAADRIPTVRIDRRVFVDVIDLDKLIEASKTGRSVA
jgi:excisionase family DNA binding protein